MKTICRRWASLLLICGVGHEAFAALRPEGDKIEFSPPRDELKVAPIRGSDLETSTFNFQRRDPGGSLSDVPSAVALPSPDRVNQVKALQEMIEKRASWSRPGDGADELASTMDLELDSGGGDISIDDLLERHSRMNGVDRAERGLGDFDNLGMRRGLDRDRESGGERRGLDARDSRDREDRNDRRSSRDDDQDRDRDLDDRGDTEGERRNGRETDGRLGDDPRGSRDGGESGKSNETGRRRDREGSSDHGRMPSAGSMEYRSMVPRDGSSFISEPVRGVSREDRLDSLRRVLGTSADTVLGERGSRSTLLRDVTGSLGAVKADGMAGALPGTSPGLNPSLSQSLDSRFGSAAPISTFENPGRTERFNGGPSRPFEFELKTGREGLGIRGDGVAQTPTSTPLEMFRRKHDARLPSRDF